ncbi:hypothetical protein [uncultured Parasphingorhabdus sp.]|uniref:hypothetical protein n=1 Tax=uncultured Parasphingorhabdus sp. TaxID=2709694 RepID=UPI002AA6FCE0|nr:hypothetical protein [uncultured Parasphingorhabdus sp.]
MNHDSALDQLAFAVGYRIMGPDARRALRISLLMEMGEKAPSTPDLATLWDEDRLIRGEREPASLYDHWTLLRAREEAHRPLFDEQFWRLRRADLEGAGFDPKEARDIIASLRASLDGTGSTDNQGDDNGTVEQEAA